MKPTFVAKLDWKEAVRLLCARLRAHGFVVMSFVDPEMGTVVYEAELGSGHSTLTINIEKLITVSSHVVLDSGKQTTLSGQTVNVEMAIEFFLAQLAVAQEQADAAAMTLDK